MRSFTFEAAGADGRTTTGRLFAADREQALARLGRDGLFPIHVRPTASLLESKRIAPPRELATALHGVEGLIRAGLPVDQALTTTAQLSRGRLASLLDEARHLVRTGAPLSAAFEQTGGLPLLVIGILRAGEQGGQLASSLGQAAQLLEREADVASRLKQALAYPILLLVTGSISVALIVGIVVPRFASLLADSDVPLPATTRLLLGISSLARAYGFPLAAFWTAATLAAVRWSSTDRGRRVRDQAVLRIPLLGALSHQLATSRVAGALGPMLSTGVPLIQALRAATGAAGNREVENRLNRARQRTTVGERFAAALESESALWPQAIRLIAIGEANGRLAEMTTRAGDLARAEAEARLKTASTLIEPALILGFALVIGFVASALLQAVYSLRPGGGA